MDTVDEGVEQFLAAGCDFLVALGGNQVPGSAPDESRRCAFRLTGVPVTAARGKW